MMVNKLLYCILFFCISLTVSGQTDNDIVITEAPPPAAEYPVQLQDTAYAQREFKPDVKSRYSGTDFDYNIRPRAKTSWDRFWEAVGRFLEDLFTVSEGGAKTSVIIVRIVLGVVVLGVIYLIVMSLIGKKGLWIFSKSHKNISAQDITEEDIRQMNFGEMINETKEQGNYRLAIRYYYLWLLKRLTNREIIEWHWDKTNNDYLYEIKNTILKQDFEYLSYIYEYSWYGDFPIDEAAFGKAEKAFQKTLNTL